VSHSITLAVVLLCPPVFSAADPVPKAVEPARVYYPTTVGTKWVMRYPSFKTDSDHTHTITAVEEKDGAEIVTVSERYTRDWNQVFQVEGAQQPVEEIEKQDRYRISPEGKSHIETYDREAKKWVKPERADRVWKWPGKPGEKSTDEIREAKYTAFSTVGKPETIKVAAGTFEAVPVYVETIQNRRELPKRTFWYVAGIGVVKSRIGDEVGVEMISFTPGKK
jgi:hypothetical protein